MRTSTRLGTLVLFAGLLATAAPRAEIIEQILVKVNGEIITKTDLEARQSAALRQRAAEQADLARMSDAELRQQLEQITPELIVEAVDELLLLQRAKELGYTMTEEQFLSVLENIKKENNIDTDEKLQAALKQEGMTMSDLRKAMERQMLIGRVQQTEVSSRVDVTEPEEKEYYDAHAGEFAATPSVMLREILVAVKGDGKSVNVSLDEEARARADTLRARIAKGESFEKVAAEASDAASKANGGLIGPLKREELTEDLQKLLGPMKVGQASPVFRVPAGYELLKLESSIDSTQLSFEQARNQIADKLYDQKRRVELDKYLKKLRSQAIIEWKNEEIQKVYDRGLTAPTD
jgi:peptidyl-prolyl cis-trans isomerase SurA